MALSHMVTRAWRVAGRCLVPRPPGLVGPGWSSPAGPLQLVGTWLVAAGRLVGLPLPPGPQQRAATRLGARGLVKKLVGLAPGRNGWSTVIKKGQCRLLDLL